MEGKVLMSACFSGQGCEVHTLQSAGADCQVLDGIFVEDFWDNCAEVHK